MDYSFAPGGTSYDRNMRKLFTYKTGVTNITAANIKSTVGNDQTGRRVSEFVLYLITKQLLTPADFPPDEIYIASHANRKGWMEIDLDDNASYTETTYEAIEQADTDDSIDVPDDVIMGGGIYVTDTIQIKGCNIGKATPFITKLKAAFGGNIPFLQAPKHYHFLNWGYSSRGIFEFMMYEFMVISKTRIRTKAALITAFQNEGHTFIDGSAVPDDRWTRYIPRNYGSRSKQIFNLRPPLGQTVAGLTRINTGREFRYTRHRESVTIPNITSRPNASQHRTLLRNYLLTIPSVLDTHPYPYYERIGYDNLDELLDNMTWSYTWLRRQNALRCNAVRYEYRVLLPITDPTSNNLLFNFYPKTGTSYTAVTSMPDSDTRLFAIV